MIQWHRQQRQIDARHQPLQQKLAIGDQQQHEGPEQQEVVESVCPAQHPLLGEGIAEHPEQSCPRVVETILLNADGYQLQALIAAEQKGEDGNSEYGSEDGLMERHIKCTS